MSIPKYSKQDEAFYEQEIEEEYGDFISDEPLCGDSDDRGDK